ncbi:MAG TPA: DUF3854 domain-containing protein, partial [Gemmataceae bacterium]|nr:DUF3854 domain-containing protein [Gemmataceae bacterium]
MSDAGIPVGGREGSGPEAVARARLSEKHIADLRASGLSWETIVQGEFRTLHDPKALNALLKRRDASRLGPCLLLPYFDLDGRQVVGYVRAKPDNAPPGKKEDGKPAKYLSPARVAIRAYFPAGAGTAILDPGRAIAVTEGEKKAAAVWQVGTAVVGLAGVECWSKRRPKGADGRAQGRR